MKSCTCLVLLIVIFISSFAFQEKNNSLTFSAVNSDYSYDIVENCGQWQEDIRFKISLANTALFLTDNGFVYNLVNSNTEEELHGNLLTEGSPTIEGHAYKVTFLNAKKPVALQKQEKRIYCHNYFLSNDPTYWKSKVPVFGRITQQQIYKGIDITLYSERGNLKYDFIIAPGAELNQLVLSYEGILPALQENGDLLLQTSVNSVIERKPEAYQIINGKKISVACIYKVNNHQVSFHFPNGYDTGNVLIIDPEIIFVGASGSTVRNLGFTATYDNRGNIYGGGIVSAIGYPTTIGAYQTGPIGSTDIALSTLSSMGDTLRYSTYLGGQGGEYPHSLVVNDNNELIVLGNSNSKDYPVSSGALLGSNQGGNDLVITRFSSDGSSILSSTYFGGMSEDGVNSDNQKYLRYNYGDDKRSEIITDRLGNIYVVSSTKSINIPVTPNAVKPSIGLSNDQDGLFAKFNPDLSTLIYCTYLGGTHNDAAYNITLDKEEQFLYISGGTCSPDFHSTAISKGWQNTYQKGTTDGFICRFENSGAYAMLSATYVGTNQYDQCHGVQVDDENNVYATGQTLGAFPVSSGVYHNANSRQFIIKLNRELSELYFSTVFGSGATTKPNISPTAFLVDRCQNIYVSGWGGRDNSTTIANFPTTNDAYQSVTDGHDFYFLVLGKDARTLKYASFLGGPGSYLHVDGGTSRFDPNGYIYQAVCAVCDGANFPVTPGVWSTVSGTNCNLGLAKIKMDFMHTEAGTEVYPGTTGCAPFTVSFNNTSLNASSYLWDFNDGTATSNEVSPIHTFDSPGVYQVTLIAANDSTCVSIDTLVVNITVLPLPAPVYQMNDTIICSGDWSKAFDVGMTLKQPGTYSTFQWEPATYINGDNTRPYINIVPNNAHEYYLTFTDSIPGYCKISLKDTLRISRRFFDPDLVLKIQEVCKGIKNGNAWLEHPEEDTSNYRYSWRLVNDTTIQSERDSLVNVGPGYYQVTLISPEGCDTILIFQIPEIDAEVSFETSDTLICTLDTVWFRNTSDPYFTDWDWIVNQHHIISDAFKTSYVFHQAGMHTIRLVGKGGQCTDTVYQSISVDSPMTKLDFIADRYQICAGESINFTPGTDYTTQQLYWDFGDGNEYTTEHIEPTTHAYDKDGIMPVILKAQFRACPEIGYADSIAVYPIPEVNLGSDSTICMHGNPIYLKNTRTAPTYPHHYRWNTGDTTAQLKVTHSGTYQLWLTAEPLGCTGTEKIMVNKDCYIDIPNAFTPNGDGENDYFFPRQLLSKSVTKFTMQVFNRWGQLIFETTSMNGRGWDGRFNGKEQPAGVYVYRIDMEIDGKQEHYHGNVTLLR